MQRKVILLATVLAVSGCFALAGCVVAPRRARVVAAVPVRVWVPGHWRPDHVWVRGYWRYR